jgi:hypothetical protein
MTNAYENLYKNIKNSMTIVENNKEYNLAEYMLMQANKEETAEESTILPVAARNYAAVSEKALSAVVSYVNDKLTIKEPPVKDKTIIAFPFRASASALLSAVACCALVLSIGIFGMGSMKENADGVSMVDYQIEDVVDSHTDLA